MRRTPSLFGACALLCWHVPLAAQTLAVAPPPPPLAATSDDLAAKVAAGVANGVQSRALGASIAPEVQLLASADEKVASLSWSFTRANVPRNNRLTYDQFTLKVAGALQEPDTDTSLFGLDGFPGGTEIKLNFTHFSGAYHIPNPGSLEEANLLKALNAAQRKCEEDHIGAENEILDAKCHYRSGLFKESNSSLLEKYEPELFSSSFDVFFPGETFKFYGLEMGANQENYKFLDTASFTTQNASKFGYSATAFAGLLWIKHPTSLTASFTYARRYEAQNSITLCKPINATQSQCITAPDGAPDLAKKTIFSIEARHAFGFSSGQPARYAIAPLLSYDVTNAAFSIDVPFYFASDGTGKLRGGVRVGYTNMRKAAGGREDNATVALFIGVPFTIFR